MDRTRHITRRNLSALAAVAWLVVAVALPVSILAQGNTEGAVGIGDPYLPTEGNGGYDVQAYDIALNVQPPNTLLNATVIIDAISTQALSRFNLDFYDFEITRLTVNGEPAAFALAATELSITPATLIAANTPFVVEVDYRGTAYQVENPAVRIETGWIPTATGSFTVGEPLGASGYFPVNDHPQDKALYTFRITVPSALTAVANGTLQAIIDNADGTRTHIWQHDFPMASYLILIAIGDLMRVEEPNPGGVPIRNYLPSDLVDEGTAHFEGTAEALNYFETLFGPYPYEVYGAYAADRAFGFALETQTISLFSAAAFTAEPGVDTVVIHELAHQWFGNSLSPATWQDIWLNEGFATYAQVLWTAYERDDPTYPDRWASAQYGLFENAQVAPNTIIGDPGLTSMFVPPVYVRGAMTLHALRVAVGDETFFEILRTYAATFAHSNVSTDDFIGVAEAVSGQDLSALFEAWLFQPMVPQTLR